MKNQELANIFYEISSFLKMKGIQFKPYAYQKAATTLENLEKDVSTIYQEGGLESLKEIPDIGESIAKKIQEYLETGKIKYYQELKKKMPVNIKELTAIEGIGPKTVKKLYRKLGVKTLKDLEKAARSGKIAPLFGFDKKTEQNILEGIKFLKKSQGRFLLGEILPRVEEIKEKLESLSVIHQISLAGSVRRRKETIGDVDLLITTDNPSKVMDFFVKMPGVIKVWGKGPTKSSVRMKQGLDVDLRVVEKKSYGSALQYFTGSKEHNIATRKIAQSKGLKLNEYGLFKGKKQIAGETEGEIYEALGMAWIPPELREDRGEIKAALQQTQGQKGGLPKLIELKDIKGDLHCHSEWDGGKNSILEMAQRAQQQGYRYLGISDHTKYLKIEQGLDEKELSEQRKEIQKLNSKFKDQGSEFRLLQGAETNILKDGSIDIQDQALEKLDYAIAGIHSHFKMRKAEMTERIIRAMKNPHVKIISHPTGRILKKRDEYKIDIDKIFRAAQEYDVILEINSFPQRLDLDDVNIKKAKEKGVRFEIGTDSHHRDHLRYMELGVYQARRGWAEKEEIINTYPLKKLLKCFK